MLDKIFLQAFCGLVLSIGLILAGLNMMNNAKAAEDGSVKVETAQIVYYQEMKNLGGGTYLCEVWTHSYLDTTLMKLTASEKAKLQRVYRK